MKKLQVIKEFQSLIPSLTKEEYDLLEQNILKEGIRDPIIVYGTTIVDGHNRYKIAQKHDLEFDTIDKKFGSMDEAITWVIENQLGRRNIFDFTRYELVVMVVESELLIVGKEKQIRKSINSVLSPDDKTESHNTQEIIAKKLGWGSTKVVMAKFVKQNANSKTLQRLREGKISINKVYKEIKKSKKISEVKEGLSIVDKTKDIQNTNFKINSTEKSVKYELMAPSELDNATIEHMENNKISDKEKAAIDLWYKGINYEYYIKEEV